MLEHNNILQQENALLKAQLGSTQELLHQLRTTQENKISALADKLKEQVGPPCTVSAMTNLGLIVGIRNVEAESGRLQNSSNLWLGMGHGRHCLQIRPC